MNAAYWKAFVRQRGILSFLYLVGRKFISWFSAKRFARCDSLLLSGSSQINGHKFISIGKMSAGTRFRMEAIGFSYNREFSPEIVIGRNVSFGNDIHIGCVSRIVIGDNVLCGSHVVIIDHDHGCYADGCGPHSVPTEPPAGRKIAAAQIQIENNVHVGDCVVILKGVTIGAGTVIGAGSVVTRSIPENCIAVGNPARAIKQFDPVEGRYRTLRA